MTARLTGSASLIGVTPHAVAAAARLVSEPLALDPNKVKPGWIAFFIVIGLCIATFFLWRNMNTQLKRITVPRQERPMRRIGITPTDDPPHGTASAETDPTVDQPETHDAGDESPG